MTKKVDRAGMIPFYVTDEGEILMMFMVPSDPTYGGSEFQIAKGKVDEGENHEAAAIRECEEELGLKMSNVISDVHFLGKYLGRMHIYIVQVESLSDFNPPHFETGQVGWLSPDHFEEEGRELHRPLVHAAQLYIKEKILS